MWRKAFVGLLSLNLLAIVGFTLWWGSLPKASQVQTPVQSVTNQDKTATVQLSIGQDAINTYLEYALSDQKDVQRVLSYATVHFSHQWEVQIGLKLRDRVVPCDLVFSPIGQDGNLSLHVDSATMGEIPVPTSALFFVFKHLPWPAWIKVDSAHEILMLNFTERPQHPYGIEIISYSPQTKLLTLKISIVPKSLLKHS